MKNCRLYLTCNSNLCPLDKALSCRNWFIGEDVCNLPENRRLPMVRRQRQLNRLRPAGYMDAPLSPQWLRNTARQRRELSEEQKEVLRIRLRGARAAKCPA